MRYRLPSRRPAVSLLCAALALATAAACGGGKDDGTPEGLLETLSKAVSASDDAAIAALICPEARTDGQSIAEVRTLAAEADPALANLGYEAHAGPVTDRTDTTAVGTITISVKGVPDDLSRAGQQFLDSVGAPRPISLMHENGRINLVKRDGTWQACE